MNEQKMNETDKQILYQTRPMDGFRYFAASETSNLPAMYTCGMGRQGKRIVVVARNFEKHFDLDEFDKAIAYYKMACQENGYDVE